MQSEEFWITESGKILDADSNTGNRNHDAVVTARCTGMVVEQLSRSGCPIGRHLGGLLGSLDEEHRDDVVMLRECLINEIDAMVCARRCPPGTELRDLEELLAEAGADPGLLAVALDSQSDGRRFAYMNWDWIRLVLHSEKGRAFATFRRVNRNVMERLCDSGKLAKIRSIDLESVDPPTYRADVPTLLLGDHLSALRRYPDRLLSSARR